MKLQLQFWLYVATLIVGTCAALACFFSFVLVAWSFLAGGPGIVTGLLIALGLICWGLAAWLQQCTLRLEKQWSKEVK
jgi:hypothetical protein